MRTSMTCQNMHLLSTNVHHWIHIRQNKTKREEMRHAQSDLNAQTLDGLKLSYVHWMDSESRCIMVTCVCWQHRKSDLCLMWWQQKWAGLPWNPTWRGFLKNKTTGQHQNNNFNTRTCVLYLRLHTNTHKYGTRLKSCNTGMRKSLMTALLWGSRIIKLLLEQTKGNKAKVLYV